VSPGFDPCLSLPNSARSLCSTKGLGSGGLGFEDWDQSFCSGGVFRGSSVCVCGGLFTDRATEANNSAEEMFGSRDWKRLARLCRVSECRNRQTVAKAVRGFVRTSLPFDDITIFAVCRLEPSMP
jgi:hypothetical protein